MSHPTASLLPGCCTLAAGTSLKKSKASCLAVEVEGENKHKQVKLKDLFYQLPEYNRVTKNCVLGRYTKLPLSLRNSPVPCIPSVMAGDVVTQALVTPVVSGG